MIPMQKIINFDPKNNNLLPNIPIQFGKFNLLNSKKTLTIIKTIKKLRPRRNFSNKKTPNHRSTRPLQQGSHFVLVYKTDDRTMSTCTFRI